MFLTGVWIRPLLQAERCVIFGSAQASVIMGTPNGFSILTFDAFDNPLTGDTASFAVEYALLGITDIDLSDAIRFMRRGVQHAGDNLYEVFYDPPSHVRLYALEVRVFLVQEDQLGAGEAAANATASRRLLPGGQFEVTVFGGAEAASAQQSVVLSEKGLYLDPASPNQLGTAGALTRFYVQVRSVHGVSGACPFRSFQSFLATCYTLVRVRRHVD